MSARGSRSGRITTPPLAVAPARPVLCSRHVPTAESACHRAETYTLVWSPPWPSVRSTESPATVTTAGGTRPDSRGSNPNGVKSASNVPYAEDAATGVVKSTRAGSSHVFGTNASVAWTTPRGSRRSAALSKPSGGSCNAKSASHIPTMRRAAADALARGAPSWRHAGTSASAAPPTISRGSGPNATCLTDGRAVRHVRRDRGAVSVVVRPQRLICIFDPPGACARPAWCLA